MESDGSYAVTLVTQNELKCSLNNSDGSWYSQLADKRLVLSFDFDAINGGPHPKLFEHTVISLQEKVPIHAPPLEDQAVLAQLVLLQEVQHCL